MPRSSSTLQDNPNWNEISTLISIAVVVCSTVKQASHSQLYVPETMHLATLIAAAGPISVRKSVYGIIMNLLQSLYQSRLDDPTGPSEILQLIEVCTQPESLQLFGLSRLTPTSDYTIYEPPSDKVQIENQEGLTNLLIRAIQVAATSTGR